MALFAISDLHLSLTGPYLPGDGEPPLSKPMDVFGPAWQDCFGRLVTAWQQQIAPDDTVLIPGDISWALTLDDAHHDLQFLRRLPGRKIIVKGNHDYWWSSLSRVRAELGENVQVLQHSAVEAEGWAICGTRGWLTPAAKDYKESVDRRLYERELLRLEMALLDAAKLNRPILCLLHFPPLLAAEASGFSELLSRYQVRLCLYGHIHGDKAAAFEGQFNGVCYRNVSMDRLNFTPLRLVEAGQWQEKLI